MDAVAAQLFGFNQGFLLAWVGVDIWGMGSGGRLVVLVGGVAITFCWITIPQVV
jgi:hypothetical protein